MKDLQLLLKEMESYKIITRPRILKCYAYSNVQNSMVSAGSRDFEYHHAEPFLHFKIITSASSLFARLFEKNQIRIIHAGLRLLFCLRAPRFCLENKQSSKLRACYCLRTAARTPTIKKFLCCNLGKPGRIK